RAKELGYSCLACTDHNGVHGAVMFAIACRDAGIQAITGVELTLRHGLVAGDLTWPHLTLLAATRDGYTNLCTLISAAHQGIRPWEHKEPWRSQGPGKLDRAERPASGEVLPAGIDPSFLEGHTEGLIVLTGCRDGELSRLVDA